MMKNNKKRNDEPKDKIDLFRHLLVKSLANKTNKLRKVNDGNNKIIVIVKEDGLGDYILFLNVLRYLTKVYEGYKFYFICARNVYPLAIHNKDFEEVIAISREETSFFALKKFHAKLAHIKADILLSMAAPRTVEAELASLFINAKTKIAYLGERGALSTRMKSRLDLIYDQLIDTDKTQNTLVQAKKFLHQLIPNSDYLIDKPYLEIEDEHIYLPEDEYYVLFLGGSVFNKKWPPQRFAEVANHIYERTKLTPILIGDEYDIEEEEEFLKYYSHPHYSFMDKLSILEALYVIKKAKFVLSNDSFPVHAASAFNVPSIVVRGQFSGNKFYPYVLDIKDEKYNLPIEVCKDTHCKWCTLDSSGYFCLHGEYNARRKVKCLNKVEPMDVIHKVDELLDKMEVQHG